MDYNKHLPIYLPILLYFERLNTNKFVNPFPTEGFIGRYLPGAGGFQINRMYVHLLTKILVLRVPVKCLKTWHIKN